jgi:hypothetical protein
MTNVSRILYVAAMAMTFSGVAAAQAVTAFDGTYSGVSRDVSGSGPNCGAFAPELRPLTIRNGVAQFEAGLKGATVFQGNVSAQGDLSLKDNLTDTILGKIDQTGKATGSIHLGGENCVISAVWQKK